MGLMGRIKVLWLGFWSNIVGSGERNVAVTAKGAIENHKLNLTKVQNALTSLIFQRKKVDDQVTALDEELLELEKDLDQAVREERDNLALVLISQVEKVKEEHSFLSNQKKTLEIDIEQARRTETQLKREVGQAEQMLGSLTSRYEALKIRKQLQTQLNQIQSAVSSSSRMIEQPLADHVHRLEAEIESSQLTVSEHESELLEMRASRKDDKHQEILDRIKHKIKGHTKTAAVGTVAHSTTL